MTPRLRDLYVTADNEAKSWCAATNHQEPHWVSKGPRDLYSCTTCGDLVSWDHPLSAWISDLYLISEEEDLFP